MLTPRLRVQRSLIHLHMAAHALARFSAASGPPQRSASVITTMAARAVPCLDLLS
jgi:hypothetical protein